MIGAIFWNYLSVVFSFIAETISWERWEGTLEYTFMAPVRRMTQLLGSIVYAMVYGLDPHGRRSSWRWSLFFRTRPVARELRARAAASCCSARSASSASRCWPPILPLLYVERGEQMAFVMQSVLLLVSGVYYSVDVLPGWMQVIVAFSPATYVLDGVRAGPDRRRRRSTRSAGRHLAAARDGHRVHPVRPVGLRPGRALRQADRQAQESGVTMLTEIAGLSLRVHAGGTAPAALMAPIANAVYATNGMDEMTTVADLRLARACTAGFDPSLDVVLAEVDGTLVAYGWVTGSTRPRASREFRPGRLRAPRLAGAGASAGGCCVAGGARPGPPRRRPADGRFCFGTLVVATRTSARCASSRAPATRWCATSSR